MKNLINTLTLGTFLATSSLTFAAPSNHSILVSGETDKGPLMPGRPYKSIDVRNHDVEDGGRTYGEYFNDFIGSIKKAPELESLTLFGFDDRQQEEKEAVKRARELKGSYLKQTEVFIAKIQSVDDREDRMIQLAAALKGRKLKHLYLGGELDVDDMGELAPALRDMDSLEVVDFIQSPHLRGGGLRLVTEMVPGWRNLRGLYLSHCSLTDHGAGPLLEALRGHPSLRGLSLAFNDLSMAMVQPVCELLDSCPTLAALQLRGNHGDDSLVWGVRKNGYYQGKTGADVIHEHIEGRGWPSCDHVNYTLVPGGFIIQPRTEDMAISVSGDDLFKIYKELLKS